MFTDADVFFEPLALRKAVAFAESDRLDHLTAFPDVLAESAWERLFLAFFGLIFSMNAPLGRIENRESRAHVGVGAFNLVRLEALRAIGGLRHLALSVDEDMRLGQALKYAGYRARILFGRGEVAVRWQVGMGGMIRGLEKNFFAALDFRVAKAIVASVGLVSLGVLPYLGLFLGPLWARLACGLGVASIAIMLGASTRHSRIGWAYSALLPIAAVALVFALGRSTLVTFWRGGVRWRDHLYPLEDLQRHVRARNAWLREVWRSTR